MKHRIYLLISLILSITFAKAQTPSWIWAQGTGEGNGNCVAIDDSGYVYVAGSFNSDSIVFGAYTLFNHSHDSTDLFLVKYSSAGNVIWATSSGGVYNDYGVSLKTDHHGNICLTGWYFSPSITFNTVTLINNNPLQDADAFLAKYDHDGNVLWAKGISGNLGDNSFSVATDNSDNIYITGEFGSVSMILDTITLLNYSSPYLNLFIAKYSSTGDIIWAKSIGGNEDEVGRSVFIDDSNFVYITGTFESASVIFGTDTLFNVNPVNSYGDQFIVKYDSDGNEIFARSYGGLYSDGGFSVTVDHALNIYTTGIRSMNGTNLYINKYNSLGNLIWTKNFSSPFSVGESIATDNAGNIFVAGWFKDSVIDFDGILLHNNRFQHDDLFLVKYDSSGAVIWAKEAGGNMEDQALSVAISNSGEIYITGFFINDTIQFDGMTIFNSGWLNYYLAKINSTVPVTGSPGCGDLLLERIQMDDDTTNLMKVTISNSCSTCTPNACVYLNLNVIRTVFPFDTLAGTYCWCLVNPDSGNQSTYSVNSIVSSLPLLHDLRVSLFNGSCGCDTVPFIENNLV